MIPLKCYICLHPSNKCPQDFKTIFSDFMRLFSKFPSCSLNCVQLDKLTLCESCWIYFMRVHQFKHQLRLKKDICDTAKSFLRSKIRRAQKSLAEIGNNLSSCKDFESQISASQDNDDSDSDASGHTVGDTAEPISCSSNSTDDDENESLQSCETSEVIPTDNVPTSPSSLEKEPRNETGQPQADMEERNPLLLDLSQLMAPVEDHPRYSPQLPSSVYHDSDVESIQLYEISDVVAPSNDSISMAPSSAEEAPAEAASGDTNEFHSESQPAKRLTQGDEVSISSSSSEEEPAEATSDDTSESDSDSEPATTRPVTLRSRKLRKKVKRSSGWKIRSSDVKKLSETEFTYLKKYAFSRTDVGFKCGLCPAISNIYKGSSRIEYNMLRHIKRWHMSDHRVRATKVHHRFVEIAPNRFQYGNYKVELIDGNYRCEECGEVRGERTGRYNIMHHIRSHHESTKRSYVCEFCGKVYRTPFNLSEHTKVKHATNTQRFPCSKCDKTFVSRSKAVAHHKNVHQGLYNEKFICEICGKECSQKHILQDHIAFIHHGQRMKCDLCDKSFGSRIALSIHRHCHLGTKFTCDICGMNFSQAYSVTRHKKTAHNE